MSYESSNMVIERFIFEPLNEKISGLSLTSLKVRVNVGGKTFAVEETFMRNIPFSHAKESAFRAIGNAIGKSLQTQFENEKY